MEKDIIGLKKAINMLENNDSEESYEKAIKSKLFNSTCSKECYY